MATAFLKGQSLGRIWAGHPWVYATDLLRIEKAPEDGGEIAVRNADGVLVGVGFYNSKSRIPIRIFSRSRENLDEAFFERRIAAALALRENPLALAVDPAVGAPGNRLPLACRLVWSEADFLPGLIADRYGDALVIQTLTRAMDQRREMLADKLRRLTGVGLVVERNDAPSRQFEGLELRKGILRGEGDARRVVRMGWIDAEVDLLGGQKTAAYLDQMENHVLVGTLAQGKRVLDCFTYQGGFALHAAKAGAVAVEAVDISEEAVAAGRRNAELNGISNVAWRAANVFDDLGARRRKGEKFDLVILDPPSFTRTREKLPEALRGYKEIHLQAMKLLNPGGMLATFCCSHHVTADTFRAVVLDAAFDLRRVLRLIRAFSQAPDHPVIPAIPETEYLKGFLFQMV